MSNPYGQSPYASGPGPQAHPQGTTILVLGIVSLFTCFVVGIIALVMGNKAIKEIDANPGAYTNRQHVVVGRILGIVTIVYQSLAVVGWLVFVVLLVGTSTTGTR